MGFKKQRSAFRAQVLNLCVSCSPYKLEGASGPGGKLEPLETDSVAQGQAVLVEELIPEAGLPGPPLSRPFAFRGLWAFPKLPHHHPQQSIFSEKDPFSTFWFHLRYDNSNCFPPPEEATWMEICPFSFSLGPSPPLPPL